MQFHKVTKTKMEKRLKRLINFISAFTVMTQTGACDPNMITT
jgi:hypothetical protein